MFIQYYMPILRNIKNKKFNSVGTTAYHYYHIW